MVLIAFAISSCEDKTREETADVIILSRSNVAFAEQGGETTVAVASPSQWTADCPDSWVTLKQTGELLAISADGNVTGDVRSSKITVKSANDEHQIVVHQAYSRDAVHLSLSVSGDIEFDSEGDNCIFTVLTDGKWDATSDASWLNIAVDQNTSTLTVSVPKNSDKHRSAKVVITAKDATTTAQREVAVSQISHDENAYFKLLGYYGLYAQNWYYGGKSLGVAGTGTHCTIEQKEYRKSVYIKDLFYPGTVIEAAFDKNTNLLSIELGRKCLSKDISATVTRNYYILKTNVDTRKFFGGTLTAKLGTGKDDYGTVRKALLLDGFEADFKGLGLICSDKPNEYAYILDLYYAAKTMYLVEADKTENQNAVTQAAGGIPVEKEGIGFIFNN